MTEHPLTALFVTVSLSGVEDCLKHTSTSLSVTSNFICLFANMKL